MSVRLVIDRLGAQGDGIAQTERGPVFVPFTLPGETVNAAVERDRATLMAVLDPSPQRVAPPCRHFGECGGCSLQHLEERAYRAFKRDRVVQALAREGIDGAVDDLVACRPGSRRRVSLGGRRTLGGMLLGYHRMQSSEIIDIAEDPIALPSIVAALPKLRQLSGLVVKATKPFRLLVTATESGLDLAFDDVSPLGDTDRRAVVAAAISARVARLSIGDEIVVEPVKPMVRFGDLAVTPPPGAFLQAVQEAEETMADLVTGHLSKAKKVADLFSGVGTFALRLARKSEVHAIEADAPALDALDRGFRMASGVKRVTTEKRDLFRRPMTFKELNAFDGVVFDPPRAGAEDQSRQIARSDVPFVAAVSCNPVTLARDLRILKDGGYRVTRVVPIDQFLWSAHVEAVALLAKPRKRR